MSILGELKSRRDSMKALDAYMYSVMVSELDRTIQWIEKVKTHLFRYETVGDKTVCGCRLCIGAVASGPPMIPNPLHDSIIHRAMCPIIDMYGGSYQGNRPEDRADSLEKSASALLQAEVDRQRARAEKAEAALTEIGTIFAKAGVRKL